MRDKREMGRAAAGYRAVSQIAVGKLCSVELAEPEARSDGEPLVLKRLLPEYADQPELEALLSDECDFLRRINSPYVVGLRGERTEGPLILEYIEGANLEVLLSACRGVAKVGILLAIFRDALHGLAAIHGVLDADGKPLMLVHQAPVLRHIMVGSDGRSRLVDLSQATCKTRPLSAARANRLQLATMAPEQLFDQSAVDARTDLFVLGVSLWEALTGQRLFASPDTNRTTANLRACIVPPPSTVGFRPPKRLDGLFTRMLARDPAKRYASAGELLSALEKVARDLGAPPEPADVAAWMRSLRAEGAALAPPGRPSQAPNHALRVEERRLPTRPSGGLLGSMPGKTLHATGPGSIAPLPSSVTAPTTLSEPPDELVRGRVSVRPAPAVTGPASRVEDVADRPGPSSKPPASSFKPSRPPGAAQSKGSVSSKPPAGPATKAPTPSATSARSGVAPDRRPSDSLAAPAPKRESHGGVGEQALPGAKLPSFVPARGPSERAPRAELPSEIDYASAIDTDAVDVTAPRQRAAREIVVGAHRDETRPSESSDLQRARNGRGPSPAVPSLDSPVRTHPPPRQIRTPATPPVRVEEVLLPPRQEAPVTRPPAVGAASQVAAQVASTPSNRAAVASSTARGVDWSQLALVVLVTALVATAADKMMGAWFDAQQGAASLADEPSGGNSASGSAPEPPPQAVELPSQLPKAAPVPESPKPASPETAPAEANGNNAASAKRQLPTRRRAAADAGGSSGAAPSNDADPQPGSGKQPVADPQPPSDTQPANAEQLPTNPY